MLEILLAKVAVKKLTVEEPEGVGVGLGLLGLLREVGRELDPAPVVHGVPVMQSNIGQGFVLLEF